jgi:metallo-beta-lactamase family protein
MAGYQAPGTRGRDLLEGKPTIRIHGKYFRAKAQVKSISGLSAHADRTELFRWLKSNDNAPDKVYLTHGEPEAAFAFADQIVRDLGWNVEVPSLDYKVNLL